MQTNERGNPVRRRTLKKRKMKEQSGKCAECGGDILLLRSELDLKVAMDGYTSKNTELVHAYCHYKRQHANDYA